MHLGMVHRYTAGHKDAEGDLLGQHRGIETSTAGDEG